MTHLPRQNVAENDLSHQFVHIEDVVDAGRIVANDVLLAILCSVRSHQTGSVSWSSELLFIVLGHVLRLYCSGVTM